MKNYKMAIFDLAGTTINDLNLGHMELQRAISAHGPQVGLGEVLQHAGKGNREIIGDILDSYGMGGTVLAQRIYKDFVTGLSMGYGNVGACALCGVVDVFRILRAHNIHIVLATSSERETALKLIRRAGWSLSGDFDLLVTPKDLGDAPTSPVSFAMKQLQVTVPAQVVRIGDSSLSIEQGKNTGCGLSVGMTTGASTRRKLREAKPDHILDNISGLIALMFKR